MDKKDNLKSDTPDTYREHKPGAVFVVQKKMRAFPIIRVLQFRFLMQC